MSEEELNQELSTDEQKDVSGGLRSDHIGALKSSHFTNKAKWTNRLTTKDKFDKATSNVNGTIGYE